MDEIEEEFQHIAIIRGKTYRYKPEDALAVLAKCRQLNKRILGLDAFIIGDHYTQPSMEHSTDYTGIDYDKKDEVEYYRKYHAPKNSDNGMHWTEAEQFIKDRINAGFVFEIVYEK